MEKKRRLSYRNGQVIKKPAVFPWIFRLGDYEEKFALVSI